MTKFGKTLKVETVLALLLALLDPAADVKNLYFKPCCCSLPIYSMGRVGMDFWHGLHAWGCWAVWNLGTDMVLSGAQ